MSRTRSDDKNDTKKKKRIWTEALIALVTNVTILVFVMVTSDLIYETNDDYGIAEMISDGYPYIGFVNYYLCKALVVLQRLLPNVNLFVLSQLVTSFLSFTAILGVFIVRNKDKLMNIIVAATTICIFAYDHYCSIQFTKTSALLMTAGLVILADNYIHKRKIFNFLLAFTFFYIGVAYRQKGMIPALAYIAVFMIIWFIFNRREFFQSKLFVKEVGLVVLIITLTITPYWLDLRSDAINASTPELKYAREYQAERVKVTDYPLLGNYEANAAKYAAVGLNENDIIIVDRFILDFEGAASLENLKTINTINYPYMMSNQSVKKAIKTIYDDIIESVRERDETGVHIITLFALAMFVLSIKKPKEWGYVICTGALTIAVYVAIYYMQRPQYRALYIADIGAAMWVLYVASIKTSDWKNPWPRRIMGVITVFILATMIASTTRNMIEEREYIEGKIEPKAITEYFEQHPDTVFVEPASIYSQRETYLTPLKTPIITPNVVATGGWETLTPHEMDKLKKLGIKNPIKDIINNPKALFYGNYKIKRLIEYYNKWHCSSGESIRFEKVDDVGGEGVYKILKEYTGP